MIFFSEITVWGFVLICVRQKLFLLNIPVLHTYISFAIMYSLGMNSRMNRGVVRNFNLMGANYLLSHVFKEIDGYNSTFFKIDGCYCTH